MAATFTKNTRIHAPIEKVWKVLTDPYWMKQWMSDAEIDVDTNWTVGSPVAMRGKLHGRSFENKGTVLEFEPEKKLVYNYWSRLPGLPDRPEHYTVIGFELTAISEETELAFSQKFATAYAHDKHAELYWTVTLDLIKKLAEKA